MSQQSRNEWLGRNVGDPVAWTWPADMATQMQLNAEFVAGIKSQPTTRFQRFLAWLRAFPSLR